MARMIDGDAVKRRIWGIVETWKFQGRKYDALLLESVIAQIVDPQPTLTPPNESLTLELVAEILAEQFGDECACNFNGNDEWLPMMCHYGDVCPDPPEHLGCWMELLRNKYCRPPEGEEDT